MGEGCTLKLSQWHSTTGSIDIGYRVGISKRINQFYSLESTYFFIDGRNEDNAQLRAGDAYGSKIKEDILADNFLE